VSRRGGLKQQSSLGGRQEDERSTGHGLAGLPLLLNADETADLLRTTRKAVYAMAERQQLPGVTRLGRRLLFRSDELLHWLNQKRAPSLE
jgi:excisionase family DNA binding protein